jgi:hypothetical protein
MSLSRTSQKSTDNKLVKTLADDFPATLEPAESKKTAKSFFSSFFSQGGDEQRKSKNDEDKMAYSLNALENMGKSSSTKPKSKSSSIFSALSFVPDEKSASANMNANENIGRISSASSSSSSGSKTGIIASFISTLQNLSWLTWFVIIVVLAFLGFNVFMYLAQTTQLFSSILAGILGLINKLFGNSVVATVQQTTNASATGAQGIVDFTASAATGGINAIQQGAQNIPSASSSSSSSSSSYTGSTAVSGITSGKPAGQSVSTTVPKQDKAQETTLNTALNSATQSLDNPQNQQNPIDDGPYQADDSYSSIQKPTSKAGWCFIGEQQNFRSCVEVGDNDICMSGNIFPTQDICVNPSLRQ